MTCVGMPRAFNILLGLRGRFDGYQQSKWSGRGIFPPPICPFKEIPGVELCAAIWPHSFLRCRADADPRQRLESAGRTKRGAPTLCAGEGKSCDHRALYAGEGKSRLYAGEGKSRDSRNRTNITFGPSIGIVR